MRKKAILVGTLILLAGCESSSSNTVNNEGGTRPSFGGASGYSGYGNPGPGASKAAPRSDAGTPSNETSTAYRSGLRTSNNSSYSGR